MAETNVQTAWVLSQNKELHGLFVVDLNFIFFTSRDVMKKNQGPLRCSREHKVNALIERLPLDGDIEDLMIEAM